MGGYGMDPLMEMQQLSRIFLLLLMIVVPNSGCLTNDATKESRNPEKQLGQLRVFLETHEDGIRSQRVKVLRSAPFEVVVDRAPILTEAELNRIELVQTELGYFIEIEADKRGSWILENYSATNSGRRFVISVVYPEQIWLAAPVIRARIADGIMRFSPDASIEEAHEIVLAVNNSIRKIKNIKKPKAGKESKDKAGEN